MARIPLASSGASELLVDHGQEGCAHGLETRRVALERAESARDRLDGGEAPWSRLLPQVSVAAGLLGRDADARQRGPEWGRDRPQRGAYAEGLGPQAALAGHSHGPALIPIMPPAQPSEAAAA